MIYDTGYTSRGTVVGGYIARQRAAQERQEDRKAQNHDPKVQVIRRIRQETMALATIADLAQRRHDAENALQPCPLTGRPSELHPSVRARLVAVLEAHAPELLGIGAAPVGSVPGVGDIMREMAAETRVRLAQAEADLNALDAGDAEPVPAAKGRK